MGKSTLYTIRETCASFYSWSWIRLRTLHCELYWELSEAPLIAILELTSECEPLNLRRGEQTVLAWKGTSVAENKGGVRLQRGPRFHAKIQRAYRVGAATCLNMAPEASSAPPETSLYIGPIGRKDVASPLSPRALSQEVNANYGRGYALAYSDGTSTEGTGRREERCCWRTTCRRQRR
ncbi:hypothetical protein PoB_005798700 [Plakobranchus ocellatus]|uniref:Uncharacterized protein n=1 Tax=Plakobranchus ocellatus TaxID=259542 RepID=A0AAV4CII7_9GAST|nr:hypothetical protein PoB_005798700 [Plakobranchus ocellatus]